MGEEYKQLNIEERTLIQTLFSMGIIPNYRYCEEFRSLSIDG
jgi:hypothetical protein